MGMIHYCGKLIVKKVIVERLACLGIIKKLFAQSIADSHTHSAMHLCRCKLWIDKLSAVMHIDNIKHLYFAKRYIHLYLRKTTAK